MRIAICPGSYDPVTYGHVNILERSAKLFDEIIAVVMINPAKKTSFTLQERMDMLRQVTKHIPNIRIEAHEGLVADYAKSRGACVLVKGLRAVSDFEYEFQMALINKKMNPNLETMFITTASQFMYLSSSAVREIAQFQGSLAGFVPPEIEQTILNRFTANKPAEEAALKADESICSL